MKIAVNTRLLLPDKLEGIGWFTYETLRRMVQAHPEHTFYFIFDRNYDERFIFADNVQPVLTFPPARHPYLWYLYFEHAIPYVLKKINPDLFLSTDGWLSLQTEVPQVNVIHDLNFEHHPEYLRRSHRNYYQKYFPQFAQKAVRLATVSAFSKQDIHSLYSVDNEKIDVVYNGCNEAYSPLEWSEQLLVRARYSAGKNYFLFVSAIHKRKNLANILRAFELFKERTGSDVQFLVVGARAGVQDDVDSVLAQMKHASAVRFLGHTATQELTKLMASSLALVYASLFEGFGIPIVEAFYAETAVITSTVTSMPEVAGEAACLVDPLSVEQMAEAMSQIATNESFRQSLIEKGRQQRRNFSWDKTAAKLWNCVEKAMITCKSAPLNP